MTDASIHFCIYNWKLTTLLDSGNLNSQKQKCGTELNIDVRPLLQDVSMAQTLATKAAGHCTVDIKLKNSAYRIFI